MSVTQSHPVIEQLIRDNPKFHYYSEEQVRKDQVYAAKFGLHDLKPGATSAAVHPDILRRLPEWVGAGERTLETGCGQTTVALAAIAKHHVCVVPDTQQRRAVEAYMDAKGVSRTPVTFMEESSATALAKLREPLDFAYVDGCHGYPFPALDWYFIDQHLKVGSLIAFDNAEIPSVRYHCDFLDANQSYTLVEALVFRDWGHYTVRVYRKDRHEDSEWHYQRFNEVQWQRVNGRSLARRIAGRIAWRLGLRR